MTEKKIFPVFCEKCGQEFAGRECLKYHAGHGACKRKDYICKYCKHSFTSSTNMYRHMKHNCKVKKDQKNEMEKIYELLLGLKEDNKTLKKDNQDLKKDNDSLKRQMNKLLQVPTITKNTTINNENNNINHGVVINTYLVAHGKEDRSRLDTTDLIKVLKSGFNSTIKLTEAVNFNPRFPEYHNVYISSIKDKYAMVYDGKDWKLVIRTDLVEEIYENNKDYIEENMERFFDSLSASCKRSLNRWLNTEEEDDKIKKIKDDIKLLLYNSRKMVVEGPYNPYKSGKLLGIGND
jgi:hypothetical protein